MNKDVGIGLIAICIGLIVFKSVRWLIMTEPANYELLHAYTGTLLAMASIALVFLVTWVVLAIFSILNIGDN